MSITLTKINKQMVAPIQFPKSIKKIKGADICSEVYANIFICSKKKTGKSTVLFHLLKECLSKKTCKEVIIFCTTAYKDAAWIEIRKWLDKNEIPSRVYTSLNEDGVNQIEELVSTLNDEAKEAEQKEESDQPEKEGNSAIDLLEKMNRCHNDLEYFLSLQHPEENKPKQKKGDKYLAPQYFIILDDIGNQLKNPALTTLLNWNRHYRAKVIISSQYLNHLLPDSRKMLDLWLIFKGHPDKKLLEIYSDCDASIPFELFRKMYLKATRKPYSFFYYDTRKDQYRRNFDTKFKFPELENDDE